MRDASFPAFSRHKANRLGCRFIACPSSNFTRRFCSRIWWPATPAPRLDSRGECYDHSVRSLTRDVIVRALNLLAEQLPPGRPPVDLIVVGGAAMVLLFAARESTKLAPGRELKARFAFDDLWESQHGTA